MEQQFKKGDYVVLLTDCMGNSPSHWSSLPTNHVYKLREDFSSTRFHVVKDMEGNKENGWYMYESSSNYANYVGKLTVRAATEAEIAWCEAADYYPLPTDEQPQEPNYELF